MTQHNYQVTYLNGETKILHTFKEVSTEVKLKDRSIQYIMLCNGNYGKAISDKLTEVGVKKIIKLESTIVPYKKSIRKKKYYDKKRLEPDEVIKYYSETYGGNWKYNAQYNIVVSDEGLAGSLNKNLGLLSSNINNRGYVRCSNSTMHKVVWETFKGKIPAGYDVDHIDNNKTNNKLPNLQLLTHKENCKKRDVNGSVHDKKVYCFLNGEVVKSFHSVTKAAYWIAETGQCRTGNPYSIRVNIYNAMHKDVQAYGYKWSFSNELGE